MSDLGIFDGDTMLVDKSLEILNNDLAMCVIENEFTAKIIDIQKDCVLLKPANKRFPNIRIDANNDIELIVWGIVTTSFKRFRK